MIREFRANGKAFTVTLTRELVSAGFEGGLRGIVVGSVVVLAKGGASWKDIQDSLLLAHGEARMQKGK